MMKNKIILILPIALFIAALIFWFQSPKQQIEPHKSSAEEDNNQTIELRFGHNLPTNSAMHQAAVKFSENVFSRSNGQIKITIHPSQELGNDHQMVEMTRAGKLDVLLTPTAKMSVPVPAMQFADLPFLFPNRDVAYAVLDGEPGRLLLDKVSEINLVGITFWENGFKHFTANKSVTRPEDFEGMQFRVMKSRIIMEQFKALGATPVPIDFHSTRQALLDGVVDGQENPLVAIVSMGFHEVQSHMTLSNHAYLGYVLSFSSIVFNNLPESAQQLLVEEIKKVTLWQRQETERREAEFIAKIREAGVVIEELDPEERKRFAEKTRAIADEFKLIIGADILSKAYQIINDHKLSDDNLK